MFKVDKHPTPPPSLAKKQKYNDFDVTRQLSIDFYNKCYICETTDVDYVVEHLIPHRENIDLKFGWYNLFYACQHCNNMKKEEQFYDKILDCTKEDVLLCMKYELTNKNKGGITQKNEVVITAQNEDIKTIQTAKLIENSFKKDNTGMREKSCEIRMKKLQTEMNTFMSLIIEYNREKTDILKREIISMLSRETVFSAFKKWVVLNKEDKLSEFIQFV